MLVIHYQRVRDFPLPIQLVGWRAFGHEERHPRTWRNKIRLWNGGLCQGEPKSKPAMFEVDQALLTHTEMYMYIIVYIYIFKTIEYNIIIYYIYIIYMCVFVCVCLWTIHRQNGRFTLLERGFGDPMGSPGIQQLGGSSRHQDECWVLETTYLGHVWEILGNI